MAINTFAFAGIYQRAAVGDERQIILFQLLALGHEGPGGQIKDKQR